VNAYLCYKLAVCHSEYYSQYNERDCLLRDLAQECHAHVIESNEEITACAKKRIEMFGSSDAGLAVGDEHLLAHNTDP
jgi:hypothetical protein